MLILICITLNGQRNNNNDRFMQTLCGVHWALRKRRARAISPYNISPDEFLFHFVQLLQKVCSPSRIVGSRVCSRALSIASRQARWNTDSFSPNNRNGCPRTYFIARRGILRCTKMEKRANINRAKSYLRERAELHTFPVDNNDNNAKSRLIASFKTSRQSPQSCCVRRIGGKNSCMPFSNKKVFINIL